jgi:hypothetical protein
MLDCNCSICRMKGNLHLIVPRARFTLLKGEGELATYQFNTGVAKHTFCRVCGIHPFYTPRSHPDGVDVNVRCLDDPDALERFEVEKFDGRRWEESAEKDRGDQRSVARGPAPPTFTFLNVPPYSTRDTETHASPRDGGEANVSAAPRPQG